MEKDKCWQCRSPTIHGGRRVIHFSDGGPLYESVRRRKGRFRFFQFPHLSPRSAWIGKNDSWLHFKVWLYTELDKIHGISVRRERIKRFIASCDKLCLNLVNALEAEAVRWWRGTIVSIEGCQKLVVCHTILDCSLWLSTFFHGEECLSWNVKQRLRLLSQQENCKTLAVIVKNYGEYERQEDT